MYLLKIIILCSAMFTAQKPKVDAQDTISAILQKTEFAYANASKYLDSGKLITTVTNALKTPTSTAVKYQTAYKVNGQFNLEFYKVGQSNSLYIINRDIKGETKSWWGINDKIKTHENLLNTLAEAQGISTLISTLIPKLLFAKEGSLGVNLFKEMQDMVLLKTENINSVPCYKIGGTYKTGRSTIWIGSTDFLIRKVSIEQTMKNMGFLTEYFITPFSTKSDDAFRFIPGRSIKL